MGVDIRGTGGAFGLSGPKGMPPDVIARLNGEMVKMLQDPAFRKVLEDRGYDPSSATSPAAWKAILDDKVARFRQATQLLKMKPE